MKIEVFIPMFEPNQWCSGVIVDHDNTTNSVLVCVSRNAAFWYTNEELTKFFDMRLKNQHPGDSFENQV